MTKASIVILSTDKVPERLEKFLSDQTFQDFEVILAKEIGIVRAMNRAVKRARGDIFVRIDDDVRLSKEWLSELIKPFDDTSVAGVTGPTFVPKRRRAFRDSILFAQKPKGVLKWLYDGNKFAPAGIRACGCVSYDSNYEERFKSRLSWWDEYEPDHLEGANWAVRTSLIKRVGGFDPAFDGVCEWFDDDVVFKIKKLGYRLQYNPKAKLYHMLERSVHYEDRFKGMGRIKNFLRFHWRHGRWRFLNVKFYVYLLVWGGYFIWRRFQR